MLLIRAYSESDFTQVIHLLELNIPTAFAPEEKSEFEFYLKREREDYFVVEENGTIIGCGGINYFPETKLARLSWDMIHPEMQGQGIGKKLVVHRLEQIRLKGLEEIQVRTSQVACAFYALLGFETAEIVTNYWAEGFDLVDMRLQLGNELINFCKF